jgi:hypothetical protein
MTACIPTRDRRRRRQTPAQATAAHLPYVESPSAAPDDADARPSLPRHPSWWPYGPTGEAISRARYGSDFDARIARAYDRAGLCETAIAGAGRRHHTLIRERDGREVAR